MNLLARDLCDLRGRLVLDDSVEEAVHQTVWIALARDADEAAVEETSVLQHLPDGWVAPIVRHLLRVDLYLEVVVAAGQDLRAREDVLDVEEQHVGPGVLERVVEGLLVLTCLALAVCDHTTAVADEDEHAAGVDTVEARHVRDAVRVDEDECELAWVKDLAMTRLEEALGTRALKLVDVLECLFAHVDRQLRIVLLSNSFIALLISHQIEVILEVLAAAELLQHDHLVLAHLRRHLQQLVLLLVLRQVDDIRPALLVLRLEVFEELVEALVLLGKVTNRLLQRFSLRALALDEVL